MLAGSLVAGDAEVTLHLSTFLYDLQSSVLLQTISREPRVATHVWRAMKPSHYVPQNAVSTQRAERNQAPRVDTFAEVSPRKEGWVRLLIMALSVSCSESRQILAGSPWSRSPDTFVSLRNSVDSPMTWSSRTEAVPFEPALSSWEKRSLASLAEESFVFAARWVRFHHRAVVGRARLEADCLVIRRERKPRNVFPKNGLLS